jgi:hypothetical protein
MGTGWREGSINAPTLGMESGSNSECNGITNNMKKEKILEATTLAMPEGLDALALALALRGIFKHPDERHFVLHYIFICVWYKRNRLSFTMLPVTELALIFLDHRHRCIVAGCGRSYFVTSLPSVRVYKFKSCLVVASLRIGSTKHTKFQMREFQI